MKTSNKILLGVFLTGLLSITAIHIAIYAKYKAGAYVKIETPVVERYNMHELPGNIRYLLIKDVQGIMVNTVQNPFMNIDKEAASIINYSIKGDTLVVQGDSVQTSQYKVVGIVEPVVILYLPATEKITAIRTNINLGAATTDEENLVYRVELNESWMSVDNRKMPGDTVYIKSITATATRSTIEIGQYQTIGELNLTLNNSKLVDGDGRLKKVSLQVDDSSTVELHGKNFKNTNLSIHGSN